MTPHEYGASESARSLRSRARVRTHRYTGSLLMEETKRERESKREQWREREKKREGEGHKRAQKRCEEGRFSLSVPLSTGDSSAPPPPPNGPYAEYLAAHTTGTTAIWSPFYYCCTTTIILLLFRSRASSCRVPRQFLSWSRCDSVSVFPLLFLLSPPRVSLFVRSFTEGSNRSHNTAATTTTTTVVTITAPAHRRQSRYCRGYLRSDAVRTSPPRGGQESIVHVKEMPETEF